jgi:DNA-binding transcriptional LysR family regulator
LLDLFDDGRLDAAIVQRVDDRRDGETLAVERFGWFGAERFEFRKGDPLRIAALSPTCGVRNLAAEVLDKAGISWCEVFLGGGSSAVHAAVSAGLAVAPLSYRVAPADTVDMTEKLDLPLLPSAEVVLHSSLTDPRSRAALRVLAAAFREHRTRTA